jgi:methylmalonyl-CoA mutase N-terminal domain/subunit
LYLLEDIEKYPFLSTLPGDFPYLRGTDEMGNQHEPWKVCQELPYSDPEEFNQAVRNDLEHGNLLVLAIEAARARANLGEISDAYEKVVGRHKANSRSVIGVYSTEYAIKQEINDVRQQTHDFEAREGRRPRIMVAKLGQDGL